MNMDWIMALGGGILIGISVSLMLMFNGRVTGISGIAYGLVRPHKGDLSWRFSFIFGLIFGGVILWSISPQDFGQPLLPDFTTVIVAGLLVGFGTVLGSGCTSGHGVCGISRLSPRGLVATALFITSGIVTVAILREWGMLK